MKLKEEYSSTSYASYANALLDITKGMFDRNIDRDSLEPAIVDLLLSLDDLKDEKLKRMIGTFCNRWLTPTHIIVTKTISYYDGVLTGHCIYFDRELYFHQIDGGGYDDDRIPEPMIYGVYDYPLDDIGIEDWHDLAKYRCFGTFSWDEVAEDRSDRT